MSGFYFKGSLASYIPELTKANSEALGICVIDLDGNIHQAGDYNTRFTIQSVSKVVTLILCFRAIWRTCIYTNWCRTNC